MKKMIDLVKTSNQVVLTAVFCLTSILGFAQDPAIKSGQALLDHGKKKGAIEAYQKAITASQEPAQLYYYLGRAQILAGDKAGAKASFDAGITKNPKEALNYVGLGYLLILDKKGSDAKIQFEKAIALGKKNVTTLNAIGEAYLSDRTYQKEAMEVLQKSKGYNAENPLTQLLIGNAHSMVMGQGGASANAYERALELDPKCATAEFMLGELFMSTNLPVAEEHYKKTIAIDPEYAAAQRELGELYYKKKDGANAVKHYKTYLDLTDSPEKDDRFRFAFFLFLAKDYENANKEFAELLKKPDVTSTTLKFAAQSQLKAGNLPESERIFELYLKHRDTKVDADDYNNLSDLRMKQGKDSLAMVASESSISLDQTQTDVLQTLMKYYDKKKNYSKEERICRISIKVRKVPYPNDYFYMGRALYFQQKYVNADSAFAKLNELQPKFVLGYTWSARSKAAQDGDFTDPKAKIEWLAKPAYEKVVEVGETDKEKNKKELIDAYKYLVGHYLSKQDFPKGKEYLNKILELEPDNADAKQALKDITNPPQQKRR